MKHELYRRRLEIFNQIYFFFRNKQFKYLQYIFEKNVKITQNLEQFHKNKIIRKYLNFKSYVFPFHLFMYIQSENPCKKAKMHFQIKNSCKKSKNWQKKQKL